MKSHIRQVCSGVSRVFLAGCVIAISIHPALAALTHQYTFNDGTAKDSVGSANGTLFGTNGSIVGGQLVLANNGEPSDNPGTTGAYLDLPNHLISDAVVGGGTNAVSVEMWITMLQNRDWAAAFTAGTSVGGEDVSGGDNGDQPYIQFVPRTGDGGTGNDFRVTSNSYAGPEGFVDDQGNGNGTDLAVGTKEHIVAVFNQQGPSPGNPTLPGTLTVYRNGASMGTSPIAANLDLSNFNRADFTGTDDNIWLGRSQWGDALASERVDELRIYNSALTQSDVTASFNTGPVPVALPVLRVDRATGIVTFANPAGSSFNLKGYTITSASGELNISGWTSIDAGNGFDPDGTWTTSSLTATNIAEAVTGGTLDGGTIAGGASKSIGSAWLRTPLATDLQFTYTLNGGITGTGIIEYTGAVPKRSDLNGDGAINAADWAIFVTNNGKNFTGDSTVAAYLKGDLNGDFVSDYSDYQLFKTDFIASNGAGAFSALTGVPEPGAVPMALLAALGAICFRRRQGRVGVT
jgi:Concanavalin A-like lectin/glucanases superfamily